MRVFNRSIFDDAFYGNNAKYSETKHNALLGAAENIVLEVRATQASGETNLTIDSETSNDGENWTVRHQGIVNTKLLPNTAFVAHPIVAGPWGAFLRFSIRFANEKGANIRLIACGRAEQLVR